MVSECRRYTEELRGTFRCLLKGQGSSILGAAVEASVLKVYLNTEEAAPGRATAVPTPQPGKGSLRSSLASEKQMSHHG